MLGLPLALMAAGCGDEPPRRDTVAPSETTRLVNPDWSITEMATSHGAVVIEVEAARPDDAMAIARVLVEPLVDGADEVLVYVRGRGGERPDNRRVRWTREDGYSEIRY